MSGGKHLKKKRYGGRHWTHPSVHALMDGENPARAPEDVVRERARELVRQARAYGWGGPPFDPQVLAECHGIKTSVAPSGLQQDALVRPLPSGLLEIVYSPEAPLTRRNFSVCHEIAHTIFPDCFEVVRYRRDRRSFDPDRELELLCDIAAGELLMPAEEFAAELSLQGFSAASILALAGSYKASPEAAVRRAVYLAEDAWVAVFLSERHKPSEKASVGQSAFDFLDAPPEKLRADYCVASGGSNPFLVPRHKSAPDTSCAYQVLRGGGVATAAEERWTGAGGTEVAAYVEALSLPSAVGAPARVVALLRLS